MFYQSCAQKKSHPDEVLSIDASIRYTVCDGSTTRESFDTGESACSSREAWQ
jgi:hypothetical protein